MVIAITGILASLGLVGIRSLNRSAEVTGYANQFAAAIQQATSRANTTNQLFVIQYDASGIRWGPAALTVTVDDCEAAAGAPGLTTTHGSVVQPVGSAALSAGWLCVSAPGLVTRLSSLTTCTYQGATVPCFEIRRGTTVRRVVVSASGQTEVI